MGRGIKGKTQNSKLKIAGVAENNSKLKIQNSKLPKATIQNSKIKTQKSKYEIQQNSS
ncbi:hypothetical protein [Prevotella sp.]|uniref:hypothetical protein n=1 Tax=Prevotella sp. TaxID=59823 RepID=UPI0025EDC3A8|nr:hypothetical protein [Prevotella sp.]